MSSLWTSCSVWKHQNSSTFSFVSSISNHKKINSRSVKVEGWTTRYLNAQSPQKSKKTNFYRLEKTRDVQWVNIVRLWLDPRRRSHKIFSFVSSNELTWMQFWTCKLPRSGEARYVNGVCIILTTFLYIKCCSQIKPKSPNLKHGLPLSM